MAWCCITQALNNLCVVAFRRKELSRAVDMCEAALEAAIASNDSEIETQRLNLKQVRQAFAAEQGVRE